VRAQPIVCECLLTLVEYTKTVMFMWMFIEGYYLHNIVVVTVFPFDLNYTAYYVVGWGQRHCLSVCLSLVGGV